MMPHSKRDAYGLINARLAIDFVRVVSEVLLRDPRITSAAGDTVLCGALFIGQVEKKPMTATKLAEYIGLPRPTVVRRLGVLKAHGIAVQLSGGRWRLNDCREIEARLSAVQCAHTRMLRRACQQLSILDSAAIARRH
jgi:DNA-binding transcriptional ArsR family regulator